MSKTPTYGVDAASEKANVGASHSTVSKMDDEGRVFVDGVAVFDPTTDPISQIAEDGSLNGDAEAAE